VSKPGVRSVDKGADALHQRVGVSGQRRVKVGVYGDKAAAAEPLSRKSTGEIAEIHELGLGNNPERSFVRATIEDKRAEIEAALRRGAAVVLKGELTEDQVLSQIGLKIAGDMRQRIADGIPPPLAESTLARKGADKSTPLINTGQLRTSIDAAVEAKP
jgi:hypothetical protein